MNQLEAARAEDQRTLLDLQTRLYNAAAQIWQLINERDTLAAELAELKKPKEAPKLEAVKDAS